MRNLLILGIFLVSFAGMAQRQSTPERAGRYFKELTPEQQATLRSKQLALALDLNAAQLGSIKELETQRATERKAIREKRMEASGNRSEISADDRFEWMNQRLDAQLAYKDAMKQILSQEQYEKWGHLRTRMGMDRRLHHKGHQYKSRR